MDLSVKEDSSVYAAKPGTLHERHSLVMVGLWPVALLPYLLGVDAMPGGSAGLVCGPLRGRHCTANKKGVRFLAPLRVGLPKIARLSQKQKKPGCIRVSTSMPVAPWAIHWRGAGTVRVASQQSTLFFQRDTKKQHRTYFQNPFYTTVRLTVMAGTDL